MRNIFKFALAAAPALLLVNPAFAQDCKPLTMIASIDILPTPETREVIVPAVIGGKQKKLLVDTGGVATEMTPAFADELALPRNQSMLELIDVSGRRTREYVRTSLQLGVLKAGSAAFIVMAGDEHFAADHDIVGLLAPDVLRNFDVEFDFGAGKMNLLSPDHCKGKVIYWPADAIAAVPMELKDSGHIEMPVILDGRTVYATLDTGAYNTTLSQAEAEGGYGVKPGSEDTPKVSVLPDRPNAFVYSHTFKTLDFEGVAVSDATILVMPDFGRGIRLSNATPALGSRIGSRTADETKRKMLLGMDILRHFHIYIAYKEKMIYLTPAAPPAAH